MYVAKVNVSQEECWVLLIYLGWDTWLPPSLLRWRIIQQHKIDLTNTKSTYRSHLNILLTVDHFLQVVASSHSLRKYFILTPLPLLQVERNFFLRKEQMLFFFSFPKAGVRSGPNLLSRSYRKKFCMQKLKWVYWEPLWPSPTILSSPRTLSPS